MLASATGLESECVNRIDWVTLVTVIAALIAALATSVAAIIAAYQVLLSRLTLRADLILRLDERFESSEFLNKRRAAAQALRTQTDLETVDEVLDFFEGLALLVRRKAVDEELAWHYFFYWLHGYWLYAHDYVRQKQGNDPALFAELPSFHERLLAIETRKRLVAIERRRRTGALPANVQVELPDEIWSSFLEDEDFPEDD
jgi:hypothetical protein